ncbi:hypothetical protein PQI51_08385 [Microbacterium esteraromaticum]|uniref:hypothetical protein n=1 Tax=Microbacterium esteraromaticum TaxID=57043 RepID=UPI00309E601E
MKATDESRPAGYGALLWLALATFSMGIDGYVLAGLLPQIAGDLEVSKAAAGQLVAVFALTAAVSGPVLSSLTGRPSVAPRRHAGRCTAGIRSRRRRAAARIGRRAGTDPWACTCSSRAPPRAPPPDSRRPPGGGGGC